MTAFKKTEFQFHNGYLTYDGRFVARFKTTFQRRAVPSFKRFLCQHVTVEDYFEALDHGVPPLLIVAPYGYMVPVAAARRAA